MTAETPISRLVVAADRALLSDRPTPAQIEHLVQRTTELCVWLAGRPVNQPEGYLSVSLSLAATFYIADRSERNAEILNHICRAAHKVDALMAVEGAA